MDFVFLLLLSDGLVDSVVFGGFAPHELAIRIDDCKPKAIITASNGVEIQKIIPYKPFVDKAIDLASNKPNHVIVFDRELGVEIPKKEYDVDYTSLVEKSNSIKPISLQSTDPSYILYTSSMKYMKNNMLRKLTFLILSCHNQEISCIFKIHLLYVYVQCKKCTLYMTSMTVYKYNN